MNVKHFEGEVVTVPLAWMQRDKIQSTNSTPSVLAEIPKRVISNRNLQCYCHTNLTGKMTA